MVDARDDYFFYLLFEDQAGARGRIAINIAWLKGNIKGGVGDKVAVGGQDAVHGIDFCVGLPVGLVVPFANDPFIVGQDSPHHGVRSSVPGTQPGQVETALHENPAGSIHLLVDELVLPAKLLLLHYYNKNIT